jgi:hypothetical protein
MTQLDLNGNEKETTSKVIEQTMTIIADKEINVDYIVLKIGEPVFS